MNLVDTIEILEAYMQGKHAVMKIVMRVKDYLNSI